MTDAERDAKLAALETAVSDLRRELALLRRPRIRTMRQTGRCPSCNAGTLLHFRRVRERTDSGLTDLSLLKRSSAWGFSVKEGAPLEAYACRACHLVEWHAITFEDIEVDGEHIVEITAPADPEADAGPYR